MKSNPSINKYIEREAYIKSFFLELNILNIDSDYFIQKINSLLLNKNLKNTTNVHGEMTDWKAFIEDKNFKDILYECFFIIRDYKKISNVLVDEAWGIKINKGDFTFDHNHPGKMSGVLYLNDSEQKLVFPELDIEVTPKKGTLILFNSYLRHRTNRINNSSDSKYAISFNCSKFEFLHSHHN